MSINYLSPLVEKQLPGFVREENPNFVTFLEKYYAWMETNGNPIYENYNLLNAKDVDLANDYFIKQIKDELLPSFPEEILLDDVKFLKTINQFYRSKGTPDSIKFLFKILYNEDIDIYFPSTEILKLSDGKWVLPLALRVETTDPNVFNLVKTQVRGTISDATAIVEKVVSSVDRALGVQYIELYVSNVNRLFSTGEILTASYVDGEDTITVNSKLIGSLSEIKIDPKNRGLFYKDNDPRGLFYYPEDVEIQYGGDPVTFVGGLNPDENANPKPAEAVVGEVLKGQINEIITIDGGFGFRRSIYPNTSIIDFKGGFASGRLGQESKAEIILVDEKTYRTINVSDYEIQSFFSNTINSIDNIANNKTINEITTKQSLNLYPIAFLSATSSGGGYSSRPDIETYSLYNESLDDELVVSSAFVTRKTNIIRDDSQDLTDFLEKGDIIRLYVKNRFEQVETVQQVTSNTITIGSSFETNINNLQVYKVNRRNLTQLGSLGRIKILNGGSNYNVGDYLIFTANGRGYGANAQITQIHLANSGIKAVEFNESSAYVRGGEGYTSKEFPTITVNSTTGSNAQLVVSEILGDGEKVEISTSRIGAISKIKVISYGYDYTSAPIVSLRNADLYLTDITEGLLFVSNNKVYQGESNTNTTFEAYFDKYVSSNNHVRIFNYIGKFDDTKQLKSFDDTITANIADYVFFGNGKAKATAKFENGLIRYPGIYLNEDGQPSSEKRFQDSNKYHNFSYVINTENDYKKFSKTLSDVLHPAGTKSFVTRIKKFDDEVANLEITSNNYITTTLPNTFNVFVGTGIAVLTGSGDNVNLASSIAVGDTIVFRNLLKTLNGTVSYVSGSNTITGNGTNFINDVYDGQILKLVSGDSETIGYVSNASSIITQNTLTSTVTDGTISLYYDEVDTVTFVNANTIFVSTLFEDVATFVNADLRIDLGAASSLRDIRTTLLIPSINVYAGEANNFTPVSATGGIGGISKYLISPVLPDGLVMISSNGNIRGTPTVLRSPTTYTVTALDKRSRGANTEFTLGINPAPLLAVQSIASRTLTANTLATTFKPVTPSGGYGSFRYTITPSLPSGVTFDPYSGDIGGIPGAIVTANNYTISIADDVGQNASNTFALTITPLPIVTSTIISTKSITTRIGNTFTPITSTGGYGGLTYSITPSLPTGLTFDTANGYISGNTTTTLVANTFTVTANDRAGQSVSNTFTLTVSAPEPIRANTVISFKSLTANTDDAFTPVTFTGGYGNLTIVLAPYLPTGLSIDSSNGRISGNTSELTSNSIYTIIATDEYPLIQTASNTFTMNVMAPTLTSTMPFVTKNLVVNIANNFTTLNVSGGYGEITYGISPSLPSGLSLNTSNGFISGTATANTSLTTYTVTANDQVSQTTSNTFTMKVYNELRTSRLITSRTLNSNVANSFLPVIAVTPQEAQSGNTYYFDGTTSGIGLRTDPGSALFFSTGDFTVEFWIKGNSASQAANSSIAMSHGTVSTFRYKTLHIAVGSALSGTSGKLYFSPGIDTGAYSGVDRLVTPNSVLDDTWHHIACVRSSGTASIFVDGVKVANSNTGTWAVSTFLSQGSLGANSFTTNSDQRFTGYLSNFRALKNQALYTSNFTPSISTLSSTSNTRLLLNSSSVVDSGPNTIPFNANTALPTVGTSVVFQPGFVNLTTGIAYSISPSLPTGLSFNVSNGFITGNTAQTVISNTYTVTVTDEGGQTNSATFVMTVAPSMAISTGTTLKYNYVGQDPNFTPATASGGIAPLTYSVDGLGGNAIPSGTTLDTSNGKISGTSIVKPGVAASFYPYSSTIKIVATDFVGQQASSANIVFELPGKQIPTSFTSRAIRSIIANSTYASINIGVVTGGLGNLNAYLVPVSVGESNAALYPLAFSNNVPGMTYSFVPASNTVFISGTPTKAMGVQYDESDNFLGVINDPSTEYQIYAQSFDGTRITGKGWNSGPFNLNIQASKFYANTTTSALTFRYGVANTFTPITVSGGYGINGNITFAISGNTLPDGLTFITSNGAITGSTLTLYTANTFTITANDDSFQTASNTFTLEVAVTQLYANATTPQLTYQTNRANTFTPITVSGGYGNKTFAISGNTLPDGLTFITSNGAITGSVLNLYAANTFTITANDDSFQTVSNTFTLQVVAQPLSLSTVDYYSNLSYIHFATLSSLPASFTSNGGVGNITFTVTGANTLPLGMNVYSTDVNVWYYNPAGASRYVKFGGVPEEIVDRIITVTANDESSQSVSNTARIVGRVPYVDASGNTLQLLDDTTVIQSVDLPANTTINTELLYVDRNIGYGNASITLSGNTLPAGLTLTVTDALEDPSSIGAYITGNATSTYSINTFSLLITTNTGSYYSNASYYFDLAVYNTQTANNVMSFNQVSVSGISANPQSILLPNTSQLNFGTSNFTIEFAVKSFNYGGSVLAFNEYDPITDTYTDIPATAFPITIDNWSPGFQFLDWGIYSDTVKISDGKWHHVAFARVSSTIISLFVDGMFVSNNTISSSRSINISDHKIGGDASFEISNFRVTKRALYAGGTTYTIPRLPLTSVANTVLLLKSSTIIDSSNSPISLTTFESYPVIVNGWPNTSLSIARAKSLTAIRSNASNAITASFSVGKSDTIRVMTFGNPYLNTRLSLVSLTPNLPSQISYDFNSGDYTLDVYGNMTTDANANITISTHTVTVRDNLGRQSSNTFTFIMQPRTLLANTLISNGTANTSYFTSFLPVQAKSDITITNRALSNVTNTTFSNMHFSGIPVYPSGDLNRVYLSEIRITKQALYNSSFSTPTTKPVALANTILLITSDTFTDSSNLGLSIATANNPYYGGYVTVGPTINVTGDSVHSNVYYFNGQNAAVRLLPNNNLVIGNSDFTFEFWMKASSQNTGSLFVNPSTYDDFFDLADNIIYDRARVYLSQAEYKIYQRFSTSAATMTTNNPITNNTWHHIAIVKSANSGLLFVDGVLQSNSSNYSFNQGNVLTNGITYSIAPNLPTGLTINTSNGTISGVPTVNSNNTYTITVRDSSGKTNSNTFTLNVSTSPLTLTVAYPGDEAYYGRFGLGLNANVDPAYGGTHVPLFSSNGGGGNITFTVTGANSLPSGLFLYSNTTLFADSNFAPTKRSARYIYVGGVAESITNSMITITANDETGQSVSNSHYIGYTIPQLYTIGPSPTITFGLAATNYIVMTSTGGYGNVSYTITGNTLPDGLTFITSNAAIMGTPSAAQASNTYTVTAISQSNSGTYFSNASYDTTITVVSGPSVNIMSFNEAGSGFDEMDGFTWQGLLPNDSTQLVLSSATPFTVEFWMKADAIPSAFIINTDSVNTGGAYTNGVNFWYNNGESFFSINGSGSGSRITSGAVDIFDNQWHHIALVRNGSSGKMFIDGTQQASTTSWGGINSTLQYAFIGNYQLAGDVFFGKLSNFRVTKTALYTSNFTVPTLPLVPVANTVLLLNSATNYDSSNNHLAVVALNVDPTRETGYI